MRSIGGPGDQGQAFPFYVAAIAGLLFAALAFFVVGQAGVTRSDAQGAADAAALAAAGDARDHLAGDVDLAKLPSGDWGKLLEGVGLDALGGCDAAHRFAALNEAEASCTRSGLTFAVEVKTTHTVGKSVIPGTEAMHGTANAVAIIKPRCHLGQPAEPGVDLKDDVPGALQQVKFTCDHGAEVIFDPAKPVPWRGIARKLFDVRLTD